MEKIPILKNQKKDCREAPCLSKECSWCCNPVKIDMSTLMSIDQKKLLDRNGKQIFKPLGKTLTPINAPESSKVLTFKFVNYNNKTGKCMDYNNRPEVCKNTSCINPNSPNTVNQQHANFTKKQFFGNENQ